jgi:hypothetical protein
VQQGAMMAIEQNFQAADLTIPDLPHDLLVLHITCFSKENTGRIENGYENRSSGVPVGSPGRLTRLMHGFYHSYSQSIQFRPALPGRRSLPKWQLLRLL